MKTKLCSKCKLNLPLSRFRKNSARKDGLQSFCAECHSDYRKRYYRKNKGEKREQIRKRKRSIQKWFRNYKKTLKCSNCGYDEYSVALDFHHTENKIHNVSRMAMQGFSIDSIKKEIEKCNVLCANCHRVRHYLD